MSYNVQNLERQMSNPLLTWKEIPGHFNFQEYYDEIIANAKDDQHFVEVGTFYGRSALYMAQAIKDSGKKIKFDTIDNYPPENPPNAKIFRHFAEVSCTSDYVNLIELEQLEAAKQYKDESLDFVFLDADHSFKGTTLGIQAFLPKIKKGGILAGDDYDIFIFPHVVRAVQKELKGFQLKGRVYQFIKE